MNKIFHNFYTKNDTLEVCIILFDACNLHCDFCFEDHTHLIKEEEIIKIGNNLILQLDEVLLKRSYINKFTFRLWGGELFMDGIPDSYFIAYNKLLDILREWSKKHNYESEFCFSTNLIFFNIKRIQDFITKNEKDTYIATSFDPIGRFHTQKVEKLWWQNLKLFKPKVISITLTKPTIKEYINSNILEKLAEYEVYPEYYIYNKDWQIYAPTEQEIFEFYKYCYLNKITNIPEITAIINSYKNYNGRYCSCYNSCSYINDKLTFSCILRSGTLSMLNEYGMTLPECQDNTNCTQKQFTLTVNKLKCLQCKYYSFCRLPCMASKLHKDVDTSKCALYLFYKWLSERI